MTGPKIRELPVRGLGFASTTDPWGADELLTLGRYKLTYDADSGGIYRVHLPGERTMKPADLVEYAAKRKLKLSLPRMIRTLRGIA